MLSAIGELHREIDNASAQLGWNVIPQLVDSKYWWTITDKERYPTVTDQWQYTPRSYPKEDFRDLYGVGPISGK